MQSLKTILTGPDKWCKGSLFRKKDGTPLGYLGRAGGEHHSCCLVGAGIEAGRTPPFGANDFSNQLDASASELFPDRVTDQRLGTADMVPAARFNDHPDTTFEDVIKVIEHAEAKICSAS